MQQESQLTHAKVTHKLRVYSKSYRNETPRLLRLLPVGAILAGWGSTHW